MMPRARTACCSITERPFRKTRESAASLSINGTQRAATPPVHRQAVMLAPRRIHPLRTGGFRPGKALAPLRSRASSDRQIAHLRATIDRADVARQQIIASGSRPQPRSMRLAGSASAGDEYTLIARPRLDQHRYVRSPCSAIRHTPRDQHDPIFAHARIIRRQNAQLTGRHEDFANDRDDATHGGWPGRGRRSKHDGWKCCRIGAIEALATLCGTGAAQVVDCGPTGRYDP